MAAWQIEKQNSEKRSHLLNPKDVNKTVDGKILRNPLPSDYIIRFSIPLSYSSYKHSAL